MFLKYSAYIKDQGAGGTRIASARKRVFLKIIKILWFCYGLFFIFFSLKKSGDTRVSNCVF
jgi:hypothetical protein